MAFIRRASEKPDVCSWAGSPQKRGFGEAERYICTSSRNAKDSTAMARKPSVDTYEQLLAVLRARFEQYPHRHRHLSWGEVQRRLEEQPQKLWSLAEMERTGGEPDVIGRDADTGEWLFCDCAAESPLGRRSLCYDRTAQLSRKEHAPVANAVDMAEAMGVELLTEEQYLALQRLGPFDTKTSSWLKTPEDVRRLGGALFGDYRYGRAFIYHNGAGSYYSARGFRALLRV